MKRLTITALFIALAALGWVAAYDSPSSSAASHGEGPKVSGQGDMKFRVLYKGDHLPAEAQAVLTKAHGGFAIDRREGQGETFFALPGAGIIKISADMKSTSMVSTAAEMKEPNMHNAGIWYADNGKPFLVFPGAGVGKIFTTDLNGKLVHTLIAPDGSSDLGHPEATDYFKGKGNFVPTDVDYLKGKYYISTGYSSLDYVLTARILGTNPFKAEWYDLAFGGKGAGQGQFGTGHGITVPAGTQRIDVADRPNAEIDRFTRHGQYVSTLKTPHGSFPCDVDYLGEYGIVGALHGADRDKGAPIFIYKNDRLVSTVIPKAELGLENFQHVHNAVLRHYNDKYYIIAQAWNPGDFAILEQVN